MAISVNFAGATIRMPGGGGHYYVSWSKYREHQVWECPKDLDFSVVVKFYRTFYKLTGACDMVNYKYESRDGHHAMKVYVTLGYDRAPDRSTDETAT